MTRIAIALAVLAAGAGCQTPVGNYFANRARDFGECWRAEAGVGLGAGAGVNAAGLAHVGALTLAFAPDSAVGWTYGTPASRLPEVNHAMNLEVWLGLHVASPREGADHLCPAILPAVLSLVRVGGERHWLWTAPHSPAISWARLHAFDVEVGAQIWFGVRLGFSPGEFVDFLLGWFGADIAGDDRPFAAPAERP